MSRFHTTTILLALISLGAGLSLEGSIRCFVLGLLLTAYLILIILGVSVLRLNFFVKAVCRGDITAKRVALTFDDGPDSAATPNLLKVLKQHEIKAAFFPVGKKIRTCREVIQEMDQEGHVIGNHSFRHVWWTNFLISGALDREIRTAQEAIEAAIGKVPAYFRPPMGLTNPHLRRKLKKHGLSVVGWDVRPFDTRTSVEKVIRNVLKGIRNGSIILLHETRRAPDDLARLIDKLVTEIKARGYTFIELGELTGIKAYQTVEDLTMVEPSIFIQPLHEPGIGQPQNRLWWFLAQKLASTTYVKKTIREQVTLRSFKTPPSPKFLFGLGLVFFSFLLGWPMVGLFSFLSAYFHAPALLLVGPAFYLFSHLVWLFGMYLAGKDCIKYIDIVIGWSLRKAVEKALQKGER